MIFYEARRHIDGEMRDWLVLETYIYGAFIADEETDDGDRWYYPDDTSKIPTGLHIENAGRRFYEGDLTVALPTGKRVIVIGADELLSQHLDIVLAMPPQPPRRLLADSGEARRRAFPKHSL